MRPLAPALTIALATLSICGCSPQRDCTARLYHYPHRSVDMVTARGDFSGWQPLAMEEICPCIWSVDLDLEPGDYLYEIAVDGAPTLDILEGLTGHDGDTEYSLLRVEDCAIPAWQVDDARADDDGNLSVRLTFLRASSGASLDPDSVVAQLRDGTPLDVDRVLGDSALVISIDGLSDGKHTVRVEAADTDGVDTEPLVLPLWVEPETFSWNDALIYQVVVDRFADEDGSVHDPDAAPEAIGRRMGGDLAGLTEVLQHGYFDDLGVNALWISPMVDNPDGLWPGMDGREYESYHGYWPIDPYDVEPDFGTADDLDALVTAAHERGVRVLLDVVPNHVHLEHPYYLDNADDWFNGDSDCICGTEDCPWSEAIETCWFTEYLADLDLRNTDIARMQARDVAWWVERFDLDGVRVDAVPMMPRSAVRELVWELQRRFETGDTPLYVVGETFTGSTGWTSIQRALGPFGLDGQFDFPVMWALRDALAHETATMVELRDAIAESEAAWGPPGAIMAPFIGNHDVTRFLSEAAGDTGQAWDDPPEAPADEAPYRRQVMAQAVALTLSGAPVLYYGDEYGMPGSSDPDNRRAMRFGDQLGERELWTAEQVGRIGRTRACLPALRRGRRLDVYADNDVLAYLRDVGDAQPALVVFNRAATPIEKSFTIPVDVLLNEPTTLTDVLSGTEVAVEFGATQTLTIPPMTAMLLLPAGSRCLEE
jgi:glycosidase